MNLRTCTNFTWVILKFYFHRFHQWFHLILILKSLMWFGIVVKSRINVSVMAYKVIWMECTCIDNNYIMLSVVQYMSSKICTAMHGNSYLFRLYEFIQTSQNCSCILSVIVLYSSVKHAHSDGIVFFRNFYHIIYCIYSAKVWWRNW